jgi:transcriptional regulator with XRE-family HTH domain
MSKLIQYRSDNELTQAELAQVLGVSQAQVSRLERTGSPSPTLAADIERLTHGSVPFHSWPAYAALAPVQT